MKCPNCHSLCAEKETVCYSCRRPLGESTAQKMPLSSRMAMVFGLIGGAVFNNFYPAYNPAGGIDFKHALLAGVVCAACSVVGYAVGALLSLVSKDKE
jgi:hypothetical protein